MKISEKIKKESRTLLERGLPENSYFHVIFDDDSEVDENNTNWSALSEEQIVNYAGQYKMVRVCTYKIKKITIKHNDLTVEIIPKDNEGIYQSVKMLVVFDQNGNPMNQMLGRTIGLVKENIVIEEHFLDSRLNEIIGLKF